MADTIYTRVLAQAVEMAGSAKALADLFRVPETTLARWISGRAQMPLRVFLRAIELLREHDDRGTQQDAISNRPAESITVQAAGLCARCARCGCPEFLSAVAQSGLRVSSRLQCTSCHHDAAYGDVVAELATLAVAQQRSVRKPAHGQLA